MKPEDYLFHIKTRLLNDSLIVECRITRERVTDSDTYLCAQITLFDNSRLIISEYGEGNQLGDIEVITYSYHWMDPGNHLIIRWENAEHYPNLLNFPHHHHDGDEKNVLPGEPMTLLKVLDIIATRLNE